VYRGGEDTQVDQQSVNPISLAGAYYTYFIKQLMSAFKNTSFTTSLSSLIALFHNLWT